MNAIDYPYLIDAYTAGAARLRDSVRGMSAEQLDAAPIPGKWSSRQVVCHVADFEVVYADRMKRALAEYEPTVFGGDPDTFAAHLGYERRDIAAELQMVDCIRAQMVSILRDLGEGDFQRIVRHAEAGPLSLRQLLEGITDHIPHHVAFIDQKRAKLTNSL